ncbi:SDR family NAD(P)-dependent oxidoreductase [Actinoplanes sp. NPDC049548]|uniref:SDR family NAD(P)-dependent oxidoreductase n=1 Tax=Actinoplanes sp. NPDC049548 TaxID=3155152 RepID=UPI00343B87DD
MDPASRNPARPEKDGDAGRTWFVTGASRGLGRAFAEAALRRGDRVVATARDLSALSDLDVPDGQLLTLPLDVTDDRSVRTAVAAAVDRFGGLDIVVNNAGHGTMGAVEELTESAYRAAMDVNLFGALSVTQAVLPTLRRQQHGHIIQITSMGGLVALPMASAYVASKWALEAVSESLAQEVAGFGIHVTIIEPTAFATGWAGATDSAERLPAYDPLREKAAGHAGPPPEDPAAAAQALLRVVDAAEPPLRVIFGTGGVDFIREVYQRRISDWQNAAPLW